VATLRSEPALLNLAVSMRNEGCTPMTEARNRDLARRASRSTCCRRMQKVIHTRPRASSRRAIRNEGVSEECADVDAAVALTKRALQLR
jgi:hypothetical protein